jgi:hypothetical protein
MPVQKEVAFGKAERRLGRYNTLCSCERAHDLLDRKRLGQEIDRSDLQGANNVVSVGIAGHADGHDGRKSVTAPRHEIETGFAWQLDVGEQDRGAFLLDLTHRRLRGARHSVVNGVGGQDSIDGGEHDGLVVDDEYV